MKKLSTRRKIIRAIAGTSAVTIGALIVTRGDGPIAVQFLVGVLIAGCVLMLWGGILELMDIDF